MRDQLTNPPTAAELRALSKFLGQSTAALPLANAHGLITAVASAPSMIPPSAWFPIVTGDIPFDSAEQAQKIFSILMRIFNGTLQELNAGELTLLGADREDWCRGYLLGVMMDPEWVEDHKGRNVIGVLRAVVKGQVPAGMKDPAATLAACRGHFEEIVIETYQHFLAARRIEMDAASKPTSPAVPKAGRNEACPCGSGKKFKRCCGFN